MLVNTRERAIEKKCGRALKLPKQSPDEFLKQSAQKEFPKYSPENAGKTGEGVLIPGAEVTELNEILKTKKTSCKRKIAQINKQVELQ